MTSSTSVTVLPALLLWNMAPLQCYGLRDDHGHNISLLRRQPNYTIDLVVTRHGLSCANIISDFPWAKKVSYMQRAKQAAGHRNIADPILARIGMHASLEMRSVTQDFKPDAVLASPLLRAIETAIVQYPSDTLHIVPWIREMSSFTKMNFAEGADNLPTPLATQTERLKKELNASQVLEGRSIETIDFKDWTTEQTRVDKHDWELFKEFLGNTFLPDLIPKLQKPLGSSITLAVVTHSNFMKKTSDIKADCGKYWASHSKPYNNQAVKISYNATSNGSLFSLTQNTGCTEVAPGVPYKSRKLCLHDIGESCREDIQAKKLSLPDLLEMGIKPKIDKYDVTINELTKKITEKLDPKTTQKLDQEENQEEYFLKEVQPLKDQLKTVRDQAEKLKNTPCIAYHETPDPEACDVELKGLCE